MYLGVDLGTSGIKVILMNEDGGLVDSQSESIAISRPQPLWSEQDPNDWWLAFDGAMKALASRHDMQKIKAIGLSGQMHGATLLDKHNQILRPAILWNDGRCEAQCKALEKLVPNSRNITGNIMMPGFTAPKLLWVKEHEPELFAQIHKVLLPKDYLRFLLTGDYASDMSDSAGTMWLDVAKRDWNDALLTACGLSVQQMPTLFEGNQITGHLHPDIAQHWNMPSVPVVAGAGDNAGGAIGVGLIKPGQAMISLGTSGVYFLVTDGFSANPDMAVHSFCHALPETWHLMSVTLSAASCLQWFADEVAQKSVVNLLAQLEQSPVDLQHSPIFLPYLSGERTPHNNPHAKGSFYGLTHSTNQTSMTHSVLEGVSFAFADGIEALHASGAAATEITLIGGGAKSPYWRQMLADVLNSKVIFRQGGDVGPALGAARLACLALEPARSIDSICPVPETVEAHYPDPTKISMYQQRRNIFKQVYACLEPMFKP
ncbi:xylulokinase [Aliiglaciecola sp. LCG003]|uniref:xylulokinase n=1 Tax=Aliiglaciecola sp. LCG003 TaxID=3053655 RepID=UPI002573ED17|nr:xylulokinase [Aliiglaciecola sp. LCG003]WJG08654.1 xylulokinase [Aliiglaciecola sp. LCG003]